MLMMLKIGYLWSLFKRLQLVLILMFTLLKMQFFGRSRNQALQALKLLLLLFLLWVLPHTFSKASNFSLCNCQEMNQGNLHNSEDIILGQFLSVPDAEEPLLSFRECPAFARNNLPHLKHLQHILAFVFAIHEINKSTRLLPNTTLGFKLYDNVFGGSQTYCSILDMLFPGEKKSFNYNCDQNKNIVAIIDGVNSQHSTQMATLLNVFKISQLTYGSSDSRLGDKMQFPFFYQMVPNEMLQYIGIVHLLTHFRWTWVGLLMPDDDNGEIVLRKQVPMLIQNNICIAFLDMIPTGFFPDGFSNKLVQIYFTLLFTKANVVLLYGYNYFFKVLQWALEYNILHEKYHPGKVWIRTAQWDINTMESESKLPGQTVNGTLSFTVHTEVIPGFENFLQTINPYKVYNPYNLLYTTNKQNCTEEEKQEIIHGSVFETGLFGQSYSIYNAVYAVAHALHAMNKPRTRHKALRDGLTWSPMNVQPWQLHLFLNKVRFNNSAGEEISFSHNMELTGGYDIVNWVIYPNQSFSRRQVGKIDSQAPDGKEFTIIEDVIVWNPYFNQTPPHSNCVRSCHLGCHKTVGQGEHTCCYNCVRCPEGTISIQLDAEHCEKCPEDQYASKDQVQCIPKVITYLSFNKPLGIALAVSAAFFSLVTLLVMGSFIQHRSTPIVKAANWNITRIILCSLLLSFLSIFFYFGLPGKALCFLRHTVYGILISSTLSCLLGKTLTVMFAFRTTKPGNKIWKWVVKTLRISVPVLCCLLQTSFFVVWLTTSPPFPEFDKQSQIEHMIVYCKEGSTVMFYTVNGYLCILAITSLTVAFFARKLPDGFNDTKRIAFSMVMYFSILASFILTCLSAARKYVAPVAAFSILFYNSGILGFIFLPKLYIIVLRPELNTKAQLVRKRKYAT